MDAPWTISLMGTVTSDDGILPLLLRLLRKPFSVSKPHPANSDQGLQSLALAGSRSPAPGCQLASSRQNALSKGSSAGERRDNNAQDTNGPASEGQVTFRSREYEATSGDNLDKAQTPTTSTREPGQVAPLEVSQLFSYKVGDESCSVGCLVGLKESLTLHDTQQMLSSHNI
ncbi:hypothetical protein TREES_T100009904 [Tupaia chinensis]|uniref:Uncharacterized protein n=1 Tax=Tupaia chinensis TaxID=246437 RepID=L9KQC4_TUPCH|nr:hypothetical protein TREES_T100009904 [Tupaia chinensis]